MKVRRSLRQPHVVGLAALARPPRPRRARNRPVGRYTRNDGTLIQSLFMIAGASTLGLWIVLTQ